ncbi:hypothetical protein W97_01213 [Coniosporium apollinis CBS 100218]|uniref:mRNA export factor MEX67 n=1 Tax=Coniosporium apollinis (strain CBS 100218) TaxID=1168221 RepID=R7YJB7_CONA1|nr:uncharacterized protein W97_01213 [Coniosporium apollinis CBS 100218]EON61995.1 hypothetical protein W97_01213 [Coniosporium apollinis CBS 100218]
MTTGVTTRRGTPVDGFTNRRGAIAKRRSAARTDRDGDLVMDSAAKARGGGITKGRGRGGRDGTPTGPGRAKNLNSEVFKREILRHVATGDAVPRGPRATTGPIKHMRDLKVTGYKNSKAAANDDGGIQSLLTFLEKRGTINLDKRNNARGIKGSHPIRIRKHQQEGDALIITLPSNEALSILRLDGWVFAGANIKIEQLSEPTRSPTPPGQASRAENATEVKQLLQNFLSRRYNAEMKLLDLSALGSDAELNTLGMFNSASTQSKFFPALMKICDGLFKTAQEKKDTVHSVTLADNELSSLAAVASLAPTFPDLINLDLSNNKFPNLASLHGWKHKFRHLDHLVLSGNPFEQESPDYQTQITNWYPTLRFLNGVQVRSDEEAARTSKQITKSPLPVAAPLFQDEAQIAETFITNFFAGFDSDRNALVNMYYNADTTFSLSVNSRAPRDPSQDHIKQEWDVYIKRSRNLKHIAQTPARMARKLQGQDAIREVYNTLPATRHPGLISDPQKWVIECIHQAGVPDPVGQLPYGVGGFLITIHGEYEEINISTGQPKHHRSFDRTFILGPGGATGVRIVRDMWTVRPYGGDQAWKVDGQALGQEQLVAQLSAATRMNATYSRQCLEESGWNLERAVVAFESARASLPADAFV